MKITTIMVLSFLLTTFVVMADTPPPSTVKIKDTSGNAISATAGSLNVNVTNPGGGTTTVNQGSQGSSGSPWFTSVTNFPSIQPVSQSGVWSTGRTWSLLNTTDSVNVGNFPGTQAVTQSGTWTVQQGAPPWSISASSLPLPTGASTSANQTTANTSLSSIDSKTPALGQALAAGSVPVVLTAAQLSTLTPLASVSVSNFPSSFIANAGTNLNTSLLALESGGHLASIDSKTPSLGQALSASSVPVVLTAAQLSTLTPLSSVNVGNFPGTQPVSGSLGRTWTLNSGTDSVSITGTVTAANPSVSATGSAIPSQATMVGGSDGTNLRALKVSNAGVLSVDGSAVTQPVSGTFFQATQPVSAAALPLPAGASTSALQTSGNSSLTSIDSKTPALGQALAAGSVPVVLTAAQLSTLTPLSSVSVSNFPATQPVSAVSLPLPSGAATSANQTNGTQQSQIVQGGNTLAVSASGSLLVSGLSAVGVAPSLNPIGVSGVDGGGLKRHLLTDTSGRIEIDTAQSLPLPTGAATSANQATANTTLSTISTNTTNGTQKSQLVDADGDSANIFADGSVQVFPLAKQIFLDSFDTGVDTTNKWNTPVSAGGGVACSTGSPGNTACGTGTTANGYSYMRTQASFRPSTPGWLESQSSINLEFPITANTYRFWGQANPQAVPTAANPISDGCGFEVFTDTKMYAVCYSAGSRNVIQDLSSATGNSKQPADSSVHKYFVYFRGDLAYWFIDNTENLVATMSTGAPGPIVNTLPYSLIAVAGSVAPLSSGVLNDNGTWLGDATGAQGNSISDGTLPWRQATVSATGQLSTTLPDAYTTGASAQTAVVNNILTNPSGATSTDASGYRSATVQVVSTGTAGTFIFEGSNDNVNFQTIPVFSQLILTGTPITAAITASASQLIYTFPVTVRYVRLRIVTTITGGSIQAFSRLSQATWTPAIFQVAQATAANLAVTATGSGTYTVANSAAALATDVASAAHTVNANSATITPPVGSDSNSFQLNTTAVSGTNPTLDVAIQESWDSGTTWFDVYHFERQTAAGQLVTPRLRLTGNRIRYSYTVTGTTPSFTFSIARIAFSGQGTIFHRFFDRTISLTSLNSTSASFLVNDCNQLFAGANTSGGTVAPTLDIQLSEDNTTFNSLGLTFIPPATGGQVVSASTNLVGKYARIIVTAAGTGTTDNFVWLRCRGD